MIFQTINQHIGRNFHLLHIVCSSVTHVYRMVKIYFLNGGTPLLGKHRFEVFVLLKIQFSVLLVEKRSLEYPVSNDTVFAFQSPFCQFLTCGSQSIIDYLVGRNQHGCSHVFRHNVEAFILKIRGFYSKYGVVNRISRVVHSNNFTGVLVECQLIARQDHLTENGIIVSQ